MTKWRWETTAVLTEKSTSNVLALSIHKGKSLSFLAIVRLAHPLAADKMWGDLQSPTTLTLTDSFSHPQRQTRTRKHN